MSISAGMGVLLAAGGSLLDQWRALGPALWLVTGLALAVWLAALAALAALNDPRRVRPGAALLEVQGAEPPAVVNLLTTDWDLGHEAVPATLVDLAAKRHIDIDMVGDDTFVSVRERPTDDLTSYEWMVLRHVRALAAETPERRVPAQALTTGPERSAKRWWARFSAAVISDARHRGLSRPRWSIRLKTTLVLLALPIALTAALAASTATDDPDNPDDNPVEGALAVGIGSLLGMSGLVITRSGERDTPAGRAAAARWLGLRELLEEDPVFAEQPPAAVAIWDHLLAHGTALGVAHAVAHALPLGAESDRDAWSPVGGRWRVVRVRYPDRLPPGYGMHPALAILEALGLLLGAAFLVGFTIPLFVELFWEAREDGTDLFGLDPGFVAGAVQAVIAGVVIAIAASLILVGFADLVLGRTTVEGRVLRIRDRVKRERREDGRSEITSVVRHIAVDDGTTDTVRAWRFGKFTVGRQGDIMRGRVTRFLRHVADLEVVSPLPERVAAGMPEAPIPLGTTVAAAAMSAVTALAAATAAPGGAQVGDPGGFADGGAATAEVPPLPPPDDATISAAAGLALSRDPGAPPHPAALAGASALYRSARGDHIQLSWVPAVTMDVYRRMPAALRHEVPGLGDESYRARFGGGVIARRGPHTVMVTAHLPGLDDTTRDEAAARVAAASLAPLG
jgi:hypothetical protein